MSEFDLIKKYFVPLSKDGLKDDAAVLEIPEGQALVVSSDTLNEGTHFLQDADPADIAHKALRVNLSDLAAMGAKPLAYQLNIAFPDKPEEEWLEKFTMALKEGQETFGIFCSGGDTTSIQGPLSISITAMGLVPKGKAVTREGAKEGDAIVLTGSVGDASLFLKHQDNEHFKERYYRPHPRLDLRDAIRAYAHAAIDISDGLLADLEHICEASGLGAEVHMSDAFFSPQARGMMKEGLVTAEELVSAGDDYELLLAMAPAHVDQIPGGQVIGHFKAGEAKINLLDAQGQAVQIKHTGWSHF